MHGDCFGVFPRVSEKDQRLFDLLKRAYVDARYNADYKITKAELETLYEVSEKEKCSKDDINLQDCG